MGGSRLFQWRIVWSVVARSLAEVFGGLCEIIASSSIPCSFLTSVTMTSLAALEKSPEGAR